MRGPNRSSNYITFDCLFHINFWGDRAQLATCKQSGFEIPKHMTANQDLWNQEL